MKKAILFLFSATVLITLYSAVSPKNEQTRDNKGFALIELFTSEGCSSCPPAEEVMNKLILRSQADSTPVYVIEFHVPYWDYLGWKDTLAAHENELRQQAYQAAFGLKSLYTPQAIINGKQEITGTKVAEVNDAVKKEIEEPEVLTLSCKASKLSGAFADVSYDATGNSATYVMNIALVQSSMDVNVSAGENKGKTLHHNNVVRAFKCFKIASGKGDYKFPLPNIDMRNAKFICFIQNNNDHRIMAAAQVAMPQ